MSNSYKLGRFYRQQNFVFPYSGTWKPQIELPSGSVSTENTTDTSFPGVFIWQKVHGTPLSYFVRAPIPNCLRALSSCQKSLSYSPTSYYNPLKIRFQNMGFAAHVKGALWSGHSASVVRFAEDGHTKRFQLECLAYP